MVIAYDMPSCILVVAYDKSLCILVVAYVTCLVFNLKLDDCINPNAFLALYLSCTILSSLLAHVVLMFNFMALKA